MRIVEVRTAISRERKGKVAMRPPSYCPAQRGRYLPSHIGSSRSASVRWTIKDEGGSQTVHAVSQDCQQLQPPSYHYGPAAPCSEGLVDGL